MDPEQMAALRKDAKVSLYELADRLGVSYYYVQQAEDGRKEIDAALAARIRQALLEITGERHQRVLTRPIP